MNILDYLNWRGDLTLKQAPFNEVDNLILAELSFVDFNGIVPGMAEGEGIPLKVAAEAFFRRYGKDSRKIDMGVLVPDEIPELLRRMADSPRFRDMKLNCFIDFLDVEKAEQFAALTVELGDGTVYLSFRGTDDTLAGWKEDFMLGCLPEIPAQKKAVQYVKEVAAQYPRRKLQLGGHSKGGNVAVYSGMYCPAGIQRRIRTIWSNDGPGFREEVLQSREHERVEGRIRSIIPKSSVVGMLLEHEENYTVVDSDQQGLMQHDGFSWQVEGNHFITLRQVSKQGHLNDLALKEWVRSLSQEEREKFVDGLFEVLSSTGAVTLTDLKEDTLRSAGTMVRTMKDMDKDTREAIFNAIGLLLRSNLRVRLEELQEESERVGKSLTRPLEHSRLLSREKIEIGKKLSGKAKQKSSKK